LAVQFLSLFASNASHVSISQVRGGGRWAPSEVVQAAQALVLGWVHAWMVHPPSELMGAS
jgi:hypothetical protein